MVRVDSPGGITMSVAPSSPKVKMIKIDVEGAESFVIEGGNDFFKRSKCEALLIEISPGSRFNNDPFSLYQKLRKYGYSFAYYFPENRIKAIPFPKRKEEVVLANILFLKKDISKYS